MKNTLRKKELEILKEKGNNIVSEIIKNFLHPMSPMHSKYEDCAEELMVLMKDLNIDFSKMTSEETYKFLVDDFSEKLLHKVLDILDESEFIKDYGHLLVLRQECYDELFDFFENKFDGFYSHI